MADSVADQTSKHGSNTVCAVIDLETKWLFGRGIPHAHDEYESGIDGSLDKTQHESIGGDPSKVCARRRCHQNDSPDECSIAEKLANGKSLHEISSRVLSDEVSKVED